MQFNIQGFATDRLLTLIRHPQLHSWLLVDTPAVLLVNGGSYSLPQSETSCYCAKLVESIRFTMESNNDTLILAFFCGRHRDSQDVYSKPSELMMSLLLQLVESCRGLSPAHLQACLSSLVPSDVVSICDVFERLVGELDEDFRVSIVIDGVEFFGEPADREEETLEIVRRLVGVCKKPWRATMKLLLASPSRSAFVEYLFGDGEVLTLPKYCLPGVTYGDPTLVEMVLEDVDANKSLA